MLSQPSRSSIPGMSAMTRITGIRSGLVAAAAAGAVGLGLLAAPAGAGPSPTLPPVSAEDLVSSVLTANPPAFGGTGEVVNALGMPALPGLTDPSALGDAVRTARVWSDGEGRGRVSLPSRGSERTFVEDGDTLWAYESSTRTATAHEHGALPARPTVADPAAAARALLDAVRPTSSLAVDGTGEVAGRPVYDLVLTPAPAERTLLREIRVSVDSATRMPLRLDVLTNGATEPALRVGFTDLSVEPQDPALFRFTPPEGVTVEQAEAPGRWFTHAPLADRPADGPVRLVGDGWDTVALGSLPVEALETVERVGEPTAGGWVVRSTVGTVLVLSDGRVAAGAVPQQVLAEALAR